MFPQTRQQEQTAVIARNTGKFKPLVCTVTVALIFLLAACSLATSPFGSGNSAGASRQSQPVAMALLPIESSAEDSGGMAALSGHLETALRQRGIDPVSVFPGSDSTSILSEAADAGLPYAIEATVIDWKKQGFFGSKTRMKLALAVKNTSSGEVVWRGKQTATGRIDSAVAAVAQKAAVKLVSRMPRGGQLLALAQSSGLAGGPGLSAAKADQSTTNPFSANFDESSLLKVAGGKTVQPMQGKSVAIFYGDKPPIDQLSQFDRLVLEPDAINSDQLEALTAHGARPYAYLSVGEVGPHRRFSQQIQPEWILGENTTWNSKVLDLANAGWRGFLLKRVELLHKAGYQGLFLDTMDSYHLYAETPQAKNLQEQGLITLLGQINEQFPDVRLIANRGFEILDGAGKYLEAVAAESLYASWDNNRQEYTQVSEEDREWLLGQLNKAKATHGLDIISIDYVPPSRRKEALAVAKVIAAHGFIPWVTTPELDYVGIGLLESLPRKVLMIFDSLKEGALFKSIIHRMAAMPLEYMGYVPVYHNVAREGLPPDRLRGVYAAMVTAGYSLVDHDGYQEWAERQIDDGLPMVAFGHPGFDITPNVADKLGLEVVGAFENSTAKVTQRDDIIGYERDLPARFESFGYLLKNKSDNNEAHLTYTDAKGASITPAVTGEWGGMVLNPAAFYTDVDNVVQWLIDPFAFLYKALGKPSVPMPDVTTENGKRLFLAHIDGDALPSWAEMPGRKLGAEVILEEILKPYALPHTVSIVEAEMNAFPQYFDRRKRMFDVAREIFAMPSVEIATHTYSHPFKWQRVAGHTGSGKYNLKIDNYQFDPKREVNGSAEFIDKNLAPPGKKTEVFLWSGDALPTARMLSAVYKSGLVNMNGGATTISRSNPALSLVSPMARTVGDFVQPYAPIMNENVFTNDWLGPFDGFRRVIETFQMTEEPRRIKPLNIYYHFYAGTKVASLRSLVEIYDWSVKQDINPVFVSEYAVKVPDYREMGIGRYLDGTWKAVNMGTVNTLRMIDQEMWPDLSSSKHLVGAKKLHDGVYFHTDGTDTFTFRTTEKPMRLPHLVSANGQVVEWSRKGNSIGFRITGKVPVQMELGGDSVPTCGVKTSRGVIKGKKTSTGTYLFNFNNQDTGNVRIYCQA